MAATASVVSQGVEGADAMVVMDITGDSSYPTGGYAVTVPLSSISIALPMANPATGHPTSFDLTTRKLRMFTGGGSELAGATNVSSVTTRMLFLGKR